jgi:hypothetical protein
MVGAAAMRWESAQGLDYGAVKKKAAGIAHSFFPRDAGGHRTLHQFLD